MIDALSLGAGLSWASGLRLYLTVFLVGMLARVGVVHLPDTLSTLSSGWVIGVAGVLAIVEFLADRPGQFVFYNSLTRDSRCTTMRGELIVR